jgi:nitroreductase
MTPLREHAHFLIATAGRAPSVNNSQPWRFRVTDFAIELYSDPGRRLRADPASREMLISCGAALFGLRLAVRSLGYLPVVDLLPEPGRLRLLARVRLGQAKPVTAGEQRLLQAIPHRHTHRGPFEPGQLPAGLLPGLQHDALAERATLVLVDPGIGYARLAALTDAIGRRQNWEPGLLADQWRWTRPPGSTASDGVPWYAFPAVANRQPGRLAERDFDLGRGFGLVTAKGEPPLVTTVLVTTRDGRADWLRAGQALHRVLLHATHDWVFASMQTQALESGPVRQLIRERLALPGMPQMLMQFGRAGSTHPTGRRPPEELLL